MHQYIGLAKAPTIDRGEDVSFCPKVKRWTLLSRREMSVYDPDR